MALTATGGSGLSLQKYTGASSQSFQLRAVGTASSGVAGTINGVFQAAQTAVQAGERIVLPVTRLSTTDSRWKNFEYDQGATIGKYGCLITCLAAFLNCTEDASYRPDTWPSSSRSGTEACCGATVPPRSSKPFLTLSAPP